MNGIFPALLQKSIMVFAPIHCRIFRACIAYGHIPTTWRHTKVIFISEVGKDNYFEAKPFRPINLTSFLLKTIEKLLDIRETMMGTFPLSDFQHAYQSGRFTDTALDCLSSTLVRSLNHKETALAVSLGIEGAFDKIPIATILKVLLRRNIDSTTIRWIKTFYPVGTSMLLLVAMI